jgi:predicted peptidase
MKHPVTLLLCGLAAGLLSASPVHADQPGTQQEKTLDKDITIHVKLNYLLFLPEGYDKALKKAGGDVKFTVYENAGHDSWTETYDNPEVYSWLLQHSKDK